jgi:hypothetical protein
MNDDGQGEQGTEAGNGDFLYGADLSLTQKYLAKR